MATWDDVRRIALGLPETGEHFSRDLGQWRVKDKVFVWERPLHRADLEALGDEAPDGPILGVRVEHLGAKEALLANDAGVCFTTLHFDGKTAPLPGSRSLTRRSCASSIALAGPLGLRNRRGPPHPREGGTTARESS